MNWQPIETAPRDGTWVLLRGGRPDWLNYSVTFGAPTIVSACYQEGYWVMAMAEGGYVGVVYESPQQWA